MIEIEAPDGSIVEFPDGTSDSIIKSVMSKNFLSTPTQLEQQRGNEPRFSGAQGDVFSAMQGATFNLGDEIAAGATALGSKVGLLDKGIKYDRALDTIRQMQGNFQKEHGGRALVSTIAGAIPTAIATAPAALAAMPARLAQGATIGARLGQGAVMGAEYGAAAGFGQGEGGAANRLSSAGTGATVGAATGIAGQGVAEVAKPLARYGLEGLRQTREALGYGSPSNMANRAIISAANRAGITPDEMLARMQQSQVPLSMADVGGIPMQRLARAVVTQEGPGSERAVSALTERQAGRGDRLVNAFRQYVSPMDDATQTIDDIIKARAAQGAPDYQAAMEMAPQWTSGLERMAKDPLIQRGLARGREIMRIEANARGTTFDPNDYILNSERRISSGYGMPKEMQRNMLEVPNMRALQAAKIGLDDILEGYRDPVTQRLNLDQRGRAINELRRSFLNELEKVNPAYAEANRNWGAATDLKNAVDRGRSFLRGDIDLNERAIASLTPSEKAMFRVGAARELRRQVETTRGTNDALRKFFGTTEQTRRLRALFDSNEDFMNFQKVLLDEQLAQRTEGTMLGGSQTANKQQELGMLAGAYQAPTSASNFTANILRGLGNMAVGGSRTRRADELAPLLYGTNPAEVADRLLQIQAMNMRQIGLNRSVGNAGSNARNMLAQVLAGQSVSQ